MKGGSNGGLFLAAAVCAAVLTWGASARATVTIANVTRSITSPSSRTSFPYDISYNDCTSTDAFTFPVTLDALVTGANLQVYLSEGMLDCTQSVNREANAGCVPIPGTTTPANQLNVNVVIPSSAIAGVLSGVTGCADSGTYGTGPRAINLYFMVISSPTDNVTNFTAWTMTHVDLLGPAPPTDLSAGVGESLLVMSFTESTEPDKEGYNVYCDVNQPGATTAAASSSISSSSSAGVGGGGGAGGAGGAGGTGGAGGAGGAASASSSVASSASSGVGGAASTGSGSNTCGSSVILPGQIPSGAALNLNDGQFQGPPGNATGLTNFTNYACAVAAYDQLGNVGKLSELVCGEPQPIDDFFKLYRQAGGKGGGGFCSLGDPSGASAALGVGSMFAGLWLAARRASRRRRKGGRVQ